MPPKSTVVLDDIGPDPDESGPDEDETIVDEEAPVVKSAQDDPEIVDEDVDVAPEDRLPKRAIRNADGSVTLPLKFPVTVKSRKAGKVRERKFDEFVLHRLTGVDRRLIAAASEEMMVAVALARMARLNQAVANRLDEKMDMADTNAVGQVLANFTSTGLKTGRRG